MKYAKFSADGIPTAFYSSEINPIIPADAVSITDEQWREFINNPGSRKWDGSSVVPHTPVKSPEQIAAEESAAAKAVLAQIRADIFPDLLDFVAGLPGAPANIKAARDRVNAEKLKVK